MGTTPGYGRGYHRTSAGQARGTAGKGGEPHHWFFPDNILKYTSSLAKPIPTLATGTSA